MGNFVDGFGGGVARKRARSRCHLVEHDAKTEDVAAPVDVLAQRLFWAHVVYGSQNSARFGLHLRCHLACALVQRARRLGETEIENLDTPGRCDHDVRGLDVPMYDARAMGLVQRVDNLCCDRNDFADADCTALNACSERLAFDELHRDVRRAVVVADIEDLRDVGMRQIRRGACLPLETRPPIVVGRELGWQDLERDTAAEPFVDRLHDHTHSALANGLDDPEVSQRLFVHGAIVAPCVVPGEPHTDRRVAGTA